MKKPFLYQIPEWRPFLKKVEASNAKIQKSLDPSMTDEEIEIYNDGFSEAFLVLYETLQYKAFLRIIKIVGDDYEE